MKESAKQFVWHYQRLGGSDQATLQDIEELRHLRELDPKVWAALSCPIEGLEFDRRTLDLLDSDHDGRIRVPEVLDAVEWLCARLSDKALIAGTPDVLPLAAINTDCPEGNRLATTARAVLQHLGKEECESLSPDDMKIAVNNMMQRAFNGDGILPLLAIQDNSVRELVKATLDIVGGAKDASGEAGVNQVLAETLWERLQTWHAWLTKVENAPRPVDNTEEAWALLEAIRDKVEDYFLRCDFADFAPHMQAHLNCESQLEAASNGALVDVEAIKNLPLCSIGRETEPVLSLKHGINPLWRAQVQRFATVTRSLRAGEDVLTRDEWQAVKDAFAPYGQVLSERPVFEVSPEANFAPATNVQTALDALGKTGVERLLQPEVAAQFRQLVAQDHASAAASEDVANLERLVLYYCHLHRLLMNFVSFFDFYSFKGNAIFRAGTLYISGRSCALCMPVADIDKHAELAGTSGMCLLYCQCSRHSEDGKSTVARTIVAAMTAGDGDDLRVGRNGVFVDNMGRDWDARLVKIIQNPISFQQAMWSPYKRLSQFVGNAITKFAEAKRAQSMANAQAKLGQAGTAVSAQAQGGAASMPFDVGRSVGIFAAVGIALGAIGTAVGSIAQALFALAWWQYPLLLLGGFVIISGPSIFLAWLKFQKRSLGPLLEASGWAVNKLLPINHRLGSLLTAVAEQPANMERQSRLDPFSEEKSHFGVWCIILLLLALMASGWLWQKEKIASWFGQASVEKSLSTQTPLKDGKSEAEQKTGEKADMIPDKK